MIVIKVEAQPYQLVSSIGWPGVDVQTEITDWAGFEDADNRETIVRILEQWASQCKVGAALDILRPYYPDYIAENLIVRSVFGKSSLQKVGKTELGAIRAGFISQADYDNLKQQNKLEIVQNELALALSRAIDVVVEKDQFRDDVGIKITYALKGAPIDRAATSVVETGKAALAATKEAAGKVAGTAAKGALVAVVIAGVLVYGYGVATEAGKAKGANL